MTLDGVDGLDGALAEFRSTLERDGFTAEWKVRDDGVHVRVVATDAACMECLVPEPVVQAILADALEGTGHTLAAVELPAGS